MISLRAREGDFIETFEDLIFDVKGLVHPLDKVVAYLRYLEDPSGDRRRGEKTYIKVYPLSDREKIVESRYPQYIFYDPVFGDVLQEVPHKSISKLFQPTRKVSELVKKPDIDRVETQAMEFVQYLHVSSEVKLDKIGVSGSILVDLHKDSSDIDVVVYGREDCLSIYETLKQLMTKRRSPISAYSSEDLFRLYRFRVQDTWMPLGEFVRMEHRKFSQGKFMGRDFFIRFCLDWDEVDEKYGDRVYVPLGYTKIRARVDDDSTSIFTPCRYLVSQVRILEGTQIPSVTEITSFRGRFCEQARKGELVIAQGKAEKVVERDGIESFRLVLGAKPSDFIISKPT